MESKPNAVIGNEMTPEMKEYIDVFKYKFKLMFGITPYVSITSKGLYIGELSMRELLAITNQALNDALKDEKKFDITTKTRLKPVVLYRQTFCKVASSLGYGCSAIGKFLDKNHATVIYSVKMVDNLVSVGDMDMQTCVDEVYARIEMYMINKHKAYGI